jgi:hypothetical protein
MRYRAFGSDGYADASTAAVGALVERLEAEGIATNDLWEEAIETSLSFANAGELILGDRPRRTGTAGLRKTES